MVQRTSRARVVDRFWKRWQPSHVGQRYDDVCSVAVRIEAVPQATRVKHSRLCRTPNPIKRTRFPGELRESRRSAGVHARARPSIISSAGTVSSEPKQQRKSRGGERSGEEYASQYSPLLAVHLLPVLVDRLATRICGRQASSPTHEGAERGTVSVGSQRCSVASGSHSANLFCAIKVQTTSKHNVVADPTQMRRSGEWSWPSDRRCRRNRA